MDKNLKFLDITEIKKRLIRFYFSYGGYFGGISTINIFKKDNLIECIYEHDQEEICLKYNISIEKWEEFIEKIFLENVHKWNTSYDNNNIDDGIQWELRLDFTDLPNFESYGSNKYPYNWNNFKSILYSFIPQILHDHF